MYEEKQTGFYFYPKLHDCLIEINQKNYQLIIDET
jgi:hypothetical protein